MTSNAPLITNLSTQQINASIIALRNNISESSGDFTELKVKITSLNKQYNSLNKDVNCLTYEVECIKCRTGNVSKDIPEMKKDIEALQSDVASVTNLACTINKDIENLKTCTTNICSCIDCYIFCDYSYCCINGSCVSIGKHVNCLGGRISDLEDCTCRLRTRISDLEDCTSRLETCWNTAYWDLRDRIEDVSARVTALENA